MSIHRLVISETLMAFLTGSLPLFMVVYSKPDSKVVENLSSLNPGDPVIIYFFYLFLLIFTSCMYLGDKQVCFKTQ